MLWAKPARNSFLATQEKLIASRVQEVLRQEEQNQVVECHREGSLDQAEACRACRGTQHRERQELQGHLEVGTGSHQEEEGKENR
jgi:hypothetical protein